MLDEKILNQLFEIGQREAPKEACGVLLPEEDLEPRIIQLQNHWEEPNTGFQIKSADLRRALASWLPTTSRTDDLVIWHTHPAGGVGPSRVDMRNKVKGLRHLVISLSSFGPIASWY